MDIVAKVEIKAFREGAKIPKKATEGAAGYDLCASISEYTNGMMIHPHNSLIVPTGLNVNIPEGYETLSLRSFFSIIIKFHLLLMMVIALRNWLLRS